MTEPQWRYHTPERDGHAPDDWVEGMEWDYIEFIDDPDISGHLRSKPCWWAGTRYCYRPLQDATYEPDLLAQCLDLSQDQREALIEAMQKPQRDWADEVAIAWWNDQCETLESLADVIRAKCRPKDGCATREALHSAKAFIEAVIENDPDTEIAENGMTVWDGLQSRGPEVIAKLEAALS